MRTMRAMEKNKQKMKYSIRLGKHPVYKKDKQGNIVYMTIQGEQVPQEIGYEDDYADIVDFEANINGRLHEAMVRAFGTDNSKSYAQIVCAKNSLPLDIGTRVWRTSEVKYKADGSVDETSADYVVRGKLTEGLNEDMYYLQVLNREDDD